MDSWMQCTTCKQVVVTNPTGTCLACQRGFVREMQEDNIRYPKKKAPCGDYHPPEEIKAWKKLKERRNAIEERIEQINNQLEHKDRNASGKAAETSDCDSDE